MSPVPDALRGNTGVHLSLTLGAGPAKLFGDECKSVLLQGDNPDDSDLTFLEASEGGAQADKVAVKAIQSTVATSLWRFLWENPGAEVAVVYGPHGNAVASADKPHFLMTVKLGIRPNIGGDARRTKERQDFETEWEVIDGPTLDAGA
jgi:hypothetical protein